MSDWLGELLERYHQEMAQKGHDRRLVVGPILATVQREWGHPGIRLSIGDCEIVVQSTPMGRRVFVSIDDGSAHVLFTRRDRDGKWT